MSDKLEPIAETSSASVNDGNSQVKEVKKKKLRYFAERHQLA